MAKNRNKVVVYLSDEEYALLQAEHARLSCWNRELDERDGVKLPAPDVDDTACGILATTLREYAKREGVL
jgi:hypothetical protein